MFSHQGAKVKHFDVSNVIYHKFSHGAVSYTLNGENVNVMLEYRLHNDKMTSYQCRCDAMRLTECSCDLMYICFFFVCLLFFLDIVCQVGSVIRPMGCSMRKGI